MTSFKCIYTKSVWIHYKGNIFIRFPTPEYWFPLNRNSGFLCPDRWGNSFRNIQVNILVRGNRRSGKMETKCPEQRNRFMRVYSLKDLSSPYTSRIEISFVGSMLSILILYASCTMRSKMASAKGPASPPSCSYQPSERY